MKRIAVVVSLLCLFTIQVYAQSSQDEEIYLDKIVVTPSRIQEEISRTAGNISIITKTHIERSKAKTIPELLNTQGAVIIRDYIGNGKTTNADIRSFGETGMSNVLVLVDGRRVNNIDLSGTDWIHIPISSVEKIEILKGAASVLYGDNATGGVINIITKEPSFKECELKTELITGSYGTYGEKAELSLNKGKLSALGLFDRYRTDGYRINSDLIRNDFNGKIKYSISNNLKTTLTFGNHTDKYGLPGALRDSHLNTRDRCASISPDDFARSRDYFLDLKTEADLMENGKFELSFARRKRDTFSNFVATSWMTERDTITYTANSKYLLDKDIFNHKNKLIIGIDYFDAEQDINDGGYSGNPDKLTLSKKDYGFYLTDQVYILDKLSATAGTRYETVHYNFEQERALIASDQSEFKENIFSAALNYNYSSNSNIYVSFSDSFRHPLVDEVFTSKYDFGFGPGGGLNVSLTPQNAKNYEAGIRHYINKNLFLGLSGYIMKVHNEIYYEPTTFLNSNYDNTVHRGVEFQTDFRLNEAINLFANYTFSNAEFEGGTYAGNKIPLVPDYKWNLGGNLNINKYLKLLLIGNYVSERYFISDQTNSLPRMASYFTLDTRLTFEKDRCSFYFGINNLLNEEYYEYGAANSTRTIKNYYFAPERNFILGGSLKF